MAYETARDAWLTLQGMYSSHSMASAMGICLKLQTLQKGGSYMEAYLNHVKYLADRLASIGSPLTNQEFFVHMLSGLDRDYDPLVVPLTAGNASIPFSDLYGSSLLKKNAFQIMI